MKVFKIVCVFLFVMLMVYAQISVNDARVSPRLLNYQGYLTDTLGVPITDNLDMTFKIFDAVSAGNELWSESQLNVPVERGVFSVILGESTPIPDSVFSDFTSTWLEFILEGPQILSPRTRITSVGYAYTATYSDTAEYARVAVTDTDWVISGNNVYAGVSGNVGIGTTSPGEKLQVDDGNIKIGTADRGILFYGGGEKIIGISGWGIDFQTESGTSRMTMLNNGNIGVHTTTPQVTFDVNGVICGGTEDTVKAAYGAVLGGYSNLAGDVADDTASVVAGGWNNSARQDYSFVGGGQDNTANGDYSTVGGGYNSGAVAYSFVGGGETNYASGSHTTVGGGIGNTASAQYATVSGGYYNIADVFGATVAGGCQNVSSGWHSTVGGGYAHTVDGFWGGILSGWSNTAGDAYDDTAVTVVGGRDNSATTKYAFVGGGRGNVASGNYAVVVGGHENTAIGYGVIVGCGYHNYASGNHATVGGGYDNTASGNYATVAGGYADTASATYSFATNNNSNALHDNSAAFNGQATTASGQTRVGALSKASGTFTIDHPLDPENKILNHYFVESPEMVLIYRGIATIGGDGRCEVHLPDYYDALNEKPQIQLTGVGTYEVYIAQNVMHNSFVIGGKPGAEVHWTVTGARKDPSAEITKIIMPVEQPKDGQLAGRSLDDDFLCVTMQQLEQMGKAGQFEFRTAAARQRYEEMKKNSRE